MVNIKVTKFIKSFSYSLTSNLMSTIISTLIVLIVPKLIGVEKYGYWQLYIFYTGYVGFFQFGWIDGIYLRYGGETYESLNKKVFFSQYVMMLIFQALLAFFLITISFIFITDENKMLIVIGTAVCMFITNLRGMFTYILQSTYRIREYAIATVIGRIIYCLLIIVLLFLGVRSFELLILADIIGRVFSLLYSLISCKEIVFNKISSFKFDIKETWKNISVGINLMLANIASILILGVVRLGIEHNWDISVFGKVSLAISISNMLMLFINAIALILFPVLRKVNSNKLSTLYNSVRDILMPILFMLLAFYYPMKHLLMQWIPQYAESLKYMALLFPMCVFEGKMTLLINTYLKTIRKEKMILRVNIVTLFLSIILTVFTTFILKSLTCAIVSIVFLLAFRCLFAEFYLSKYIKINIKRDNLLEIILAVLFVLSAWYINSFFSTLLYLLGYFIYLFIKKIDIISSKKQLNLLMK